MNETLHIFKYTTSKDKLIPSNLLHISPPLPYRNMGIYRKSVYIKNETNYFPYSTDMVITTDCFKRSLRITFTFLRSLLSNGFRMHHSFFNNNFGDIVANAWNFTLSWRWLQTLRTNWNINGRWQFLNLLSKNWKVLTMPFVLMSSFPAKPSPALCFL